MSSLHDPYRVAGYSCPACASPLREYQKRLVCDQCEGLLLGVEDFQLACEDLLVDAPVVLFDKTAAEKPMCPRCTKPMGTCRVKVKDKKLEGKFSFCERDGL